MSVLAPLNKCSHHFMSVFILVQFYSVIVIASASYSLLHSKHSLCEWNEGKAGTNATSCLIAPDWRVCHKIVLFNFSQTISFGLQHNCVLACWYAVACWQRHFPVIGLRGFSCCCTVWPDGVAMPSLPVTVPLFWWRRVSVGLASVRKAGRGITSGGQPFGNLSWSARVKSTAA